ncbi:MAG: glycoside hydrolase family 16 protein [Deltaproteobacteria bacterium]|nr:glycoside hydrolase family 16 protein [Deltaproteobacteria bacterium]
MNLLYAVFVGAMAASACHPRGSQVSINKPGWQLVWHDEFDQSGPPDPTRWSYEEGYVRNNEKQLYTRRLENARVENGQLVLQARKGDLEGHAFTSASLHTKGKAEFTYGRIEVRAQLPFGRGVWPAIWTLGAPPHQRQQWPECGEIDLMEYVGFEPNVIHTTIHTGAYNHVKGTHKSAHTKVDVDPTTTFNVYAIEWTPERIDFFFNEQHVFTYANEHKTHAEWPYDDPEYILLSLAIGGNWGGQHGIDESVFPQAMRVDYVRVWQRSR